MPTLLAQTTDDVRVINLDIEVVTGLSNIVRAGLSRNYSLHNEVIFNVTGTGVNDVKFNPGNGQGPINLVYGLNPPISYSSSASNVTHTLIFWSASSANPVVSKVDLTIKANSSLNNAGYLPPDEVWSVNSTATFNRPLQVLFLREVRIIPMR